MKKIRMVIYGEPGVGKSVFAVHAPKPYFITTDPNYEYLEDFGADMNAHIRVNTWAEAKEVFNKIITDEKSYSNYDTIVVDLLEDLFKWCEYEFCRRNKFDHVSDLGYGKGYDITRNEFFIEICKLLNIDKNVIFIMHGKTIIEKDRRGIEKYKYVPIDRIPDKLINMIEGRVRCFLRAYLKGEETEDGSILKRRYLSLVPKENEFGIIRGVNENSIPYDIPLDWDIFYDTINRYSIANAETVTKHKKSKKMIEVEKENENENEKEDVQEPIEIEVTETNVVKETPIVEEHKEEISKEDKLAELKAKFAKKTTLVEEKPIDVIAETVVETVVEEPIKAVEEPKPETKSMTQAERLAALKAKFAKMK